MLVDSCNLCHKVFWHPRVFCDECKVQIDKAPLLFRYVGNLGVFSLLQYTWPTDKLIRLGKGDGYPKLLEALTRTLGEKFLRHSFQIFQGIVPVPPKNLGDKDHAWRIGKTLADLLNLPLIDEVLERQISGRLEQKQRKLVGRAQIKVRLASGVNSTLDFGKKEGALLLVDDVVTSGSTLIQTWRVLGSPEAIGLTLASRPRYDVPVQVSNLANDKVFNRELDEVEKTEDF